MSLTESSNDFNKPGLSGEKGALQYMPKTWSCITKQMRYPGLIQTPHNEYFISVLKVQDLLNKNPHYTAYEIGMIWNGTLCGAKEIPIAKANPNAKVPYDTVKHAKTVLKNYYQVSANNLYE